MAQRLHSLGRLRLAVLLAVGHGKDERHYLMDIKEAMSVSRYLAHVVGRSHARQMDQADCQQWLADLQCNRSKSLDAPSWLRNSVVDLVAAHEAAYLNHYRRYAITDAA